MKKLLPAVSILLALMFTAQAVAWGPAGHKIVAAIAFRQLTPAQQQRIVAVLKQHPRFQEDFADKMPEEVEENEWIFQQAAVWPDLARGLPTEAKEEYSRPNWHFIDLPYFPTEEDWT
jgi:hypothetical protein